jgi:hypothetical protein
VQQLLANHGPAIVEAALRLLIVRARANPASMGIADEVLKVRLGVRAAIEAWEDAVDLSRGGTLEVRYRDTLLDTTMKRDLQVAVDGHVVALPADKAKAAKARIFVGKTPSEGMKPTGGPEQAQYVSDVLAELNRPENAPLAPAAAKVVTARDALVAAEQSRGVARTAESVARAELDQTLDEARTFYNQTYPRLQVLLPDDSAFVENCYLDLRNLPDDQSAAARKRVLMDVYRARIGPVPREVQSSVSGMEDDEAFSKLVALFATKSAEEIAAAVVLPKPKKG